MSRHIETRINDNYLTITLNRPNQKNAITLEMYTSMINTLHSASSDPDIRAVLIQGSEECFTAGNDLNDFAGNLPDSADNPILVFLHTINQFEKPLIAAAAGDAVGIGTTMLYHCDFVLASESTRFRMPFTHLGLIPEAGSTLLMPMYAGQRKAFELMVMGEEFDAETAVSAGLVNYIALDGNLHEAAAEYAAKIAKLPPNAVQTAKKLMKKGLTEKTTERINLEAEIFINLLRTRESQAAIMAFLSKGQS